MGIDDSKENVNTVLYFSNIRLAIAFCGIQQQHIPRKIPINIAEIYKTKVANKVLNKNIDYKANTHKT